MALNFDQTTNTIMGWSDLPSEILILIAKRLPNFTDHLRFRSVCPHWRSSFPSKYSLQFLSPQLPWLVLPSALYSLSEDRVYKIPLPGVPHDTKLYGSASGWVLSLNGSKNLNYNNVNEARCIAASVINPFTGALIEMPAPDVGSALSYVATNTLLWDRSGSVVVAACSTRRGVLYCRFGETVWSSIESQQNLWASSITFYDGRFYILEAHRYQTVVLDGETLKQITVLWPPRMGSPVQAHVFVSSGDLLLLFKYTSKNSYPNRDSHSYKVWHVNHNDKGANWVEINDIGDRALLVDSLHCFSVQVGNNSPLRRNCIYYPEILSMGMMMKYSLCIFNLGSSCFDRLVGALSKYSTYCYDGSSALPSFMLPSLS